ncbi:riboflavin biosynthesis protein RibF [Terrihalobacillus insolitus]|uniref:riboflavin biosynthesis protein RibF n=1 Tax=Terrihalobacillus insolitus TaxID=2950438 RepID=UPI0023427570|nr:riboflavin biosynthesis protein RibF [Terrihalobacillus insolitus]MDC3413871.1 riboflavin biosynthesis protein RibF [Terrihalobacillus insolitus]
MQIIELSENISADSTPKTLIIGNFDGFHRGHQHMLQTARKHAESAQEVIAVMEYPVLSQNQDYQQEITPDKDRFPLLEQYGVKRFYRLAKDSQNTSIEAFVITYLSNLHVNQIFLGEGFTFGDVFQTEEFINVCKQRNIKVTVVPPVTVNGEEVSCEKIRNFIKDGLMESVQTLLGRPFTITGTVIHGEKMGRKLGFPTINLGDVDAYVEPKPGVYFGVVGLHTHAGETEYRNVLISAGYRPTVKGKGFLVEANILHFSGDLYGRTVSVSFLRFMREEINFTDLDALIEQMNQDKKEAERLMGQ